MEKMDDFLDVRNKAGCIHCGNWLMDTEVNEDHVPTKSLALCCGNPALCRSPYCEVPLRSKSRNGALLNVFIKRDRPPWPVQAWFAALR